MNINDAFSSYIHSGKIKSLKPSTISTYITRFEAYIKPILNNLELTQQNIDMLTMQLSQKVSNKTVSDVLGLLHNILEHCGIKLEIYKPKTYRKNVEMLDNVDCIKLHHYCLNHLNYISYSLLLTLFSGIRIGELCACQVQDLDLKNGLLAVNKTMQRIKDLGQNNNKTKVIIDRPKSSSSVRQIPLILPLVETGMKIYSNLPLNAYLTTGDACKYLEPRMMEYHYKKVIEKVGIEYKKFHALRHKFASDFYKNTHDVKALSELLGHADAGITLNTYVHSDMNETRKAISQFAF